MSVSAQLSGSAVGGVRPSAANFQMLPFMITNIVQLAVSASIPSLISVLDALIQ